MREELFKALWEMTESAYKKGTSEYINVLTEKKYEQFLDQVVKICTIHNVVDMLPICSNCKKEMKLHGVAYECSCGVVKVVK